MPRGRRTRDRHGRGARRGLVPPYALVGGRRVLLPAWRGRREGFEALVGRALEPLAERWGEELGGLALQVEDVPPEVTGDEEGLVADTSGGGTIALARGVRGRPSLVVVYRKPVELRAEDGLELRDLVHDVVVEAVALLLGREPDEVDPDPQG